MGRPWTTRELAYLQAHAMDGARAVAEALGRSVDAVKQTARRYGVSLRRRAVCPRCGEETARPLDPSTGWCCACTLAARRRALEDSADSLRGDDARTRDERRALQRLYNARFRSRQK